MNRTCRMFALILVFTVVAVAQVTAQQERSLPDLVEKVAPCVYRVEVRGKTLHSDLSIKSAQVSFTTVNKSFGPNVGTGFTIRVKADPLRPDPWRSTKIGGRVVETIGYVVTNSHVVCPKGATFASPPEIRLRNEAADMTFEGELVGRDPWSDLAVIKVTRQSVTNLTAFMAADQLFEQKTGRLKALAFDTSSQLRVGESVVAVGFGYDLQGSPSVSKGIVGALNRRFLDGMFSDLIQMDAGINPGNSGGPLLNLRGEVVGVNTYTQVGVSEVRMNVKTLNNLLEQAKQNKSDAVLTLRGIADASQGLNFARSSRTAAPLIERLIHEGKIARPYFGMLESSRSIRPDQVRSLGVDQGVLVLSVFPGGAADKAGLRRGDVIVSVNNQPVRAFGDWNNLLALLPAAPTYTIGAWRYGPPVADALVRGSDRLAIPGSLGDLARQREFKLVKMAVSR